MQVIKQEEMGVPSKECQGFVGAEEMGSAKARHDRVWGSAVGRY